MRPHGIRRGPSVSLGSPGLGHWMLWTFPLCCAANSTWCLPQVPATNCLVLSALLVHLFIQSINICAVPATCQEWGYGCTKMSPHPLRKLHHSRGNQWLTKVQINQQLNVR